MQQRSIPGCMEAISMEEYLNKRKEKKEKEKRKRKKKKAIRTKRAGRTLIRSFSLVWHEIK